LYVNTYRNPKPYELFGTKIYYLGHEAAATNEKLLSKYDLSGKKVIPFNTNSGYGGRSSFDTVKELCPNSKILIGLSIKG
jgi:hypothetical protein